MNKDDIRSLLAGVLFFAGFVLLVGTVGKYELNGYIMAQEFLAKTAIGFVLMLAALPVSGELPRREKKNRR